MNDGFATNGPCFATRVAHSLYMQEWQGFRYPAVAGTDIVHELYLTSVGRIVYPAAANYPTSGHPPEYHFSWEIGRVLGDFALLWIEQGKGMVETSSLGKRPLMPGNALLLAPGEWHRYRPDPGSGWVERWVCTNGAYLHRLRMNGVFPAASEMRSVRDVRALDQAFDQLRVQSESNSLWVSGLTLTIIALALGETEQSSEALKNATSGDPLVDAAIFHIWTNCHRPLNVMDIAKHFGISRRMLERRFAQAGQRTVALELTIARVNRGRALLSEESLTVKEAGYAAGFGGARRFISAHRRILGTTPGYARLQSKKTL